MQWVRRSVRWPWPVAMLAGCVAIFMVGLPERRRACEPQVFEGSRFQVCPYDARTDALRLVLNGPDRTPMRRLSRLRDILGDEVENVRFAMNAGMFDAEGLPIGLFIEAGTLRHALNTSAGDGNFYLMPNGVLWVDLNGGVHITDTETFAVESVQPELATQSGPLLLQDGVMNSQLQREGPSRYIRNAVGLCEGGTQFVISDDPVSFGRLTRFLRDHLRCRDALYMDGAVSSLWEPSSGRLDDNYDLGPMVVVSRVEH
jgi:uncharacterized protein YigE (DUF2233 family)